MNIMETLRRWYETLTSRWRNIIQALRSELVSLPWLGLKEIRLWKLVGIILATVTVVAVIVILMIPPPPPPPYP